LPTLKQKMSIVNNVKVEVVEGHHETLNGVKSIVIKPHRSNAWAQPSFDIHRFYECATAASFRFVNFDLTLRSTDFTPATILPYVKILQRCEIRILYINIDALAVEGSRAGSGNAIDELTKEIVKIPTKRIILQGNGIRKVYDALSGGLHTFRQDEEALLQVCASAFLEEFHGCRFSGKHHSRLFYLIEEIETHCRFDVHVKVEDYGWMEISNILSLSGVDTVRIKTHPHIGSFLNHAYFGEVIKTQLGLSQIAFENIIDNRSLEITLKAIGERNITIRLRLDEIDKEGTGILIKHLPFLKCHRFSINRYDTTNHTRTTIFKAHYRNLFITESYFGKESQQNGYPRHIRSVAYKSIHKRNRLYKKVVKIAHDPFGLCTCHQIMCVCKEGPTHEDNYPIEIESLVGAALIKVVSMNEPESTSTPIFYLLRTVLCQIKRKRNGFPYI
jgi:hypothetical protein